MASEQLIRQWILLQELSAARRGRSLSELARAAEVTARTVRRDLLSLESAGFPLERVGGDRPVRFRLRPSHPLPQVPLRLEEALVLHQAALSAPLSQNPAFHEHLEAGLRKLRAALPAGVSDYLGRVEVALSRRPPARVNPEGLITVRILEEQSADRCRVRFGYRNLEGRESRRTVDPYCVRLHAGELYLLGYCHLRSEPRVFLLDRIRDCEPLEESFQIPPDFDPEKLFASSLGIYLGPPGVALVRLAGPVAQYVRERPLHPHQQIVEDDAGHLLVRVPIRGFEEITREVLRFGDRAEVLEPEELRAHVRAEVGRVAALYGRDRSGAQEAAQTSG
ncbi:MAG: transcriptional regulator [Deltaproteobacteria bacterium]|nr:transcriptional regulator [Deltaproteobacteria bacterium]